MIGSANKMKVDAVRTGFKKYVEMKDNLERDYSEAHSALLQAGEDMKSLIERITVQLKQLENDPGNNQLVDDLKYVYWHADIFKHSK